MSISNMSFKPCGPWIAFKTSPLFLSGNLSINSLPVVILVSDAVTFSFVVLSIGDLLVTLLSVSEKEVSLFVYTSSVIYILFSSSCFLSINSIIFIF